MLNILMLVYQRVPPFWINHNFWLCLCCRRSKGLIDRSRSCSGGLICLVARCAYELKPQWTPCQGRECVIQLSIYVIFLSICLSIFLYVRIHVHMSIFMRNFWVGHSSSWEWKVPSSTWRPSSAKLVWRRFSGARAHPKMGLSENSVPLHPMVLLIIIPIKWLFHWEYTLFSGILTQHFQTNPKILFLVGARWARLWSWLKLEDLMRFFLQRVPCPPSGSQIATSQQSGRKSCSMICFLPIPLSIKSIYIIV